ncbi:hypothetical protein [Cryobacterium sp. Y29]|uniref:hypothetical protein n=1 Tax=Cryobacterium sp. Y29 TaxID=2048285 RepID=UPI000CE534EE|nr:hypothetical protein [Cryobacterium sp. Y29]
MDDEILRITPGRADGAYEVICADFSIIHVVWQAGWPILLHRFPISTGKWLWIDRTPEEFESVPEIVVGQPLIIKDPRGNFRTAPVTIINFLEADED